MTRPATSHPAASSRAIRLRALGAAVADSILVLAELAVLGIGVWVLLHHAVFVSACPVCPPGSVCILRGCEEPSLTYRIGMGAIGVGLVVLGLFALRATVRRGRERGRAARGT